MEGQDQTGTDAEFRVTVGGDALYFSAAHFITYARDRCESLHGHDYRVTVSLEGGLNRHAYVHDFVDLRETVAGLLSELDHRLLLPEDNDDLRIRRSGDGVHVRFRDREYRFPASDVVHLPVSNTTAEQLAEHLARRIVSGLRERGAVEGLTRIEVEVEEAPGQSAAFDRLLDRE